MKTKHYKRFLQEVVCLAEGFELAESGNDYTADERLDQILDLCKDELERLKREGF